MKRCGFLLAMFVASLFRLSGQVSVDITQDQDQFLPGEALVAAVRITNRSGQTLDFGSDPGWLTFSVESRDGYVVLKSGDVPVTGEFSLETSKRAIKRVDLAPYFNLTKPGRYSIIANVTVKQWNQQITSAPKLFDIIEGAKLWEQEIGVPGSSKTTNQVPEVRKYTLQEANHLRKSLMLYLRLTDSAGKINKVFPIGPMISFGQPDSQVDKLNNLHVLFQNGPHSFSYLVFNPDAEMLLRQTFDYTTRPRLQTDNDGNFSVSGGRRRITSEDLPPPGNSTGTNAPAPGL
jgi:hypothetical protein